MGETAETQPTLTLADLESALRRADPAVMLLPSWLLENVIAADRGVGGPRFSIPHGHSHVIAQKRLLQLADDEGLPLQEEPPSDVPVLMLLARPDNDWLASTPAPRVLLAYWRLMFHAKIDALLGATCAGGTLDAAGVQRRIERIGRPAFREAAFVLLKERALPAGAGDAEAYAEFAATYLEILHFEPWMLHWYFPASEPENVLAVFGDDVDAGSVLAATRPPGAADPAQEPPDADDDRDRATASPEESPAAKSGSAQTRRKGHALIRRATAAERRGNDVRAALLRVRAARIVRGQAGKLRSGAARRIDALAARLRAALDLDETDYDPWRAVLRGLLSRADVGWWNNERRLLYDLQKACICHEREIYSANLVEWLLDRGRRALRRPQPAQRVVTALKALRTAERRAAKARLQPHDRAALRRLLHAAVGRAERRVRDELRPAITDALEEAGLRPHSAVERVAREKLVDELLDDVVRRGYLNLGNLRDGVSRNQLKLDDLANPRELLGRDPLLRADVRLEHALDGVYHRGEFYLRLFQRLSSVLFGTSAGRFVTRVMLIPFLGALILLEGIDHSVGLILHKTVGIDLHFASRWSIVLLAIFIMALVNWPAFRAAAWRWARALGRALRAAVIDFPKWLGQLPLMRLLFSSYVARMLFRYAVKPLAISAIALPLLPDGTLPAPRLGVLLGVYLVMTLLLNSPAGRAFEQTLLHALRVTLPRFTWDILVGVFRLVMHAFDRLLESVDRALYAVDEWLRFGATQNRAVVAGKAALGIVWFFVAYVTRFVVNLLIEPQINPIKHFPVVTVSHKVMLPLTYVPARAFELAGMSNGPAWTLAGGIITGTPGVFGFLAWELRENWKLYRSNRPTTLRPVRVGSHGETFAQLLRPGFHSGTLPKLFARIRKAARRSRVRGNEAVIAPAPRDHEAAHHIREGVCAFAERELVSLLNRHPIWAQSPVSVGEVELAATRIRIELSCDALARQQPAVLSFDQRDGVIVACVEHPAWMASLPPAQADLLRAALVGFYKLAGVDVVAEHVRAAYAPTPIHFDIRRGNLVVWPGEGFHQEIVHDPADTSDATRPLLLRNIVVAWPLWRRVWDATTADDISELTRQIAPGVEVLPRGAEPSVALSATAAGGARFNLSESAVAGRVSAVE